MTLRNMYREMSQGAHDITGGVAGWLKMPHSEAWYGADSCEAGAGSDVGPPDNPNGAGELVIDAINALAAAQPNFPWASYDQEDPADADGDGNFNEADGIIDHFVLVHAGVGEEGAGGDQGTYSICSHSSAVSPATGGYTIPGTNLKALNYIVQPEDGHVGVFAHDFGHDIGLPDLDDTSGGGESDVDFWDLMSSGSHTGWLNQITPTHMGAWDKFVLGWDDPLILNTGKDERDVQLGQNSRTPVGTKDSVRVNLPQKVVQLATPHSGVLAWWTNNDQDWADVKLSRTLPVPAGSNAKFRFWSNYIVEEDWEFDFVEVSTDGGATWTQQKIYNADGTLASTDDSYSDPNGRLHDYGDLKYGLTGSSGGWKELYVDLSSFTGKTIGLRGRTAGRRRRVPSRAPRAGLHPARRDVPLQPVLPGRVAEQRRVRQGPPVGVRHGVLPPRHGRVDGHARAVQRAGPAGLVPGHPVRQRQPRDGDVVRPAEHRLEGRPADRGLALRARAADGRRRYDAPEHSFAGAELERRVQPVRLVSVHGVHRDDAVQHGVHRHPGAVGGADVQRPLRVVSRHRAPRRRVVLPRHRCVDGDPVPGQPALHHTRGAAGRHA